MRRRFAIVDVFSPTAFTGNPVAVVFDAEGLDSEDMLRITRWMNLSETTFVLAPTVPEADYRLRIFTLEREMPFAGHPTLGSCRAWLASGGAAHNADKIVQECGAGLIEIRAHGETLAFAAPPLTRSGPVADAQADEACAFLGIERETVVDMAWADNGPGWLGVLLDSAETVLALTPASSHATRIDIGVVGPYPPGRPAQFELRALFSDHTGAVREDPVTGSLNASIAQWLLATGRASAPYRASQGQAVGRRGQIDVSEDPDGTVWIGGHALPLVQGQLDL